MSLTYSYAVIQLHDRKDRLWPNPVLSNLEVSPHPSVYVGQEGDLKRTGWRDLLQTS